MYWHGNKANYGHETAIKEICNTLLYLSHNLQKEENYYLFFFFV